MAAVLDEANADAGTFLAGERPVLSIGQVPFAGTTDHVRRDLTCALLVKLVSGRKLEPSVGTGQRSFETSMEKAVGFDDDHAGRATIRMAIGQPEEGHGSV
jgi:hypothetical protein